jgi:hypothetical protein
MNNYHIIDCSRCAVCKFFITTHICQLTGDIVDEYGICDKYSFNNLVQYELYAK